ncbi:MAG: acetyl/propionyl/methylcrotonyl-CoA carboxylase subunit alpha [Proteobacteria bacterium]|nr:acetyl/propionyl/methylcrotonyl-CoA carboxylase subunit alpha [Pseudomonadota bacterium]
MFSKILIANRGEIACRIAATARRMGIATVAVYSEADASARHVVLCDEAIAIGPAAAKESYLCIDKIIAAAKTSGAQAIHPGYGFLSENADFAAACAAAGLVFIGPPAAAIRAMGSKSAAKSLMEKAGVPLVPGYHGENQDADFLQTEADCIGYPVLLKSSAGGGGKGMRIVERSADFKAALTSCQREAANSFGNDRVLIEKYLSQPRHIEIQAFADTHGNCVYLFERDCSVQRRHQKVLEEAPAPGMTPERRQTMGAAAVAAAKAVGYVGAGTVEFIADQAGDFHFMEMNTRLQVEHPVTEMITRLDLVEWQLRVAAGESLPCSQEELQLHGHAIEARIYAENPEKGFLPAIGVLRHMRTPVALEFGVSDSPLPSPRPSPVEGEGENDVAAGDVVRIDSGVREGDAIASYYDPMIAKLIVWGADRAQALSAMTRALADFQVAGLATNIAFLQRLIASAPFARAQLDTGLIERHHASLFPPHAAPSVEVLALAAAALLTAERMNQNGDPWTHTSGWRLNHTLQRRLRFADMQAEDETSHEVWVAYERDGWRFTIGTCTAAVHLQRQEQAVLFLRLGEAIIKGTVVRDDDVLHVFAQGRQTILRHSDPLAHAGTGETEGGRLTAPMPGKIVALLVTAGAAVERGAPLLVMEAMKMEHTIVAPTAGVVEELLYAVGDQVSEGAQLLMLRMTEKA